jgi:hypothetical protein
MVAADPADEGDRGAKDGEEEALHAGTGYSGLGMWEAGING